MLKFALYMVLRQFHSLQSNLRAALLLIVVAIGFSSCYTNRSIMLKTPEDYPFATYIDSLNDKETYKIAVADIISMNLTTNDGVGKLSIVNDPGSAIGGGSDDRRPLQQYVVEIDSTINVPVIGRIKVVGLTIRQCELLLEERFDSTYNEPFVELKVTNRRFMVFIGGNTARVITMINEKTTLIEGLALAGGISSLSKAHNIKLIRGGLSKPTVYQIDMSTLEGARLGGSMVLQANDIIYVEPVKRNVEQAIQTTLVYTNIAVGFVAIFYAIFGK